MTVTHILSPDTEATLLLCGRFGKSESDGARPLTAGEYNLLAQWLVREGRHPADLLGLDTGPILDAGEPPVPADRIRSLLDRGGALALAVEGWSNRGLWVVARGDEAYPDALRAARGSPPLLYGAGDPALLARGGLAIVGSRHAGEEALAFARRVAEACAEQAMGVVSGGARGIDTEAMLATINAGGTAVGILSDSLGRSALSGRYREAIASGRLVLASPYHPASGFNAGNAMGRNRYIYALADFALVVSSDTKGGTWSGAEEALKGVRTPVFVRDEPGAPEGNRALLAKGARPFPDEPWTALSATLVATAREATAERPIQGELL